MLIRLQLLTHSDFMGDRNRVLGIKKQFLESFPQPALLSEKEWDLKNNASIPELKTYLTTAQNEINIILSAGVEGIAALEALQPDRSKHIVAWVGEKKFSNLSHIAAYLNLIALPANVVAELNFDELNPGTCIIKTENVVQDEDDFYHVKSLKDNIFSIKTNKTKSHLQKARDFFYSFISTTSSMPSQLLLEENEESTIGPCLKNSDTDAEIISKDLEKIVLNKLEALKDKKNELVVPRQDAKRFYLTAGATLASVAALGFMLFSANTRRSHTATSYHFPRKLPVRKR